MRAFPPVVLDGIEATLVSESSEEPSPPLFKCADEIISASGERIKFRLPLHATERRAASNPIIRAVYVNETTLSSKSDNRVREDPVIQVEQT